MEFDPKETIQEVEERYKTGKTSVWWQLDKCRVPNDSTFDHTTIADNITSALFNLNLYGQVSIFAYGDVHSIPNSIRHSLISTGISLHQPNSDSQIGTGIAKILVDMLLWAVDNPPPANYVLISGDCNFAHVVEQLKIRSYNILLVQPHDASLVAAANSVLSWSRILAGGSSLSNGKELNISKVSSVKIGIQDQSTVMITSSPQAKKFEIAPHELLTPSMIVTSTTSSSHSNGITQIIAAPDKLFHQNKQPSVQFNFAPDKFFHRDPPIEKGPVTSDIDASDNSLNQVNKNFGNLDLGSFNPDQKENGYHLDSGAPEEPSLIPSTDLVISNHAWQTPDYIQGLVGTVLLALHTLKTEKIIPTEANISDCIKYGDSLHKNIDVKMALHYGVDQQLISRLRVGATEVYIGKNGRLWNCVNPLGGNPNHYSKAIWNAIEYYLSSPDGQFKMTASECRYEAAMHLKNSCLKIYALGDALQILNIIVHVKKWIKPHASGWQPIRILTAVSREAGWVRVGE